MDKGAGSWHSKPWIPPLSCAMGGHWRMRSQGLLLCLRSMKTVLAIRVEKRTVGGGRCSGVPGWVTLCDGQGDGEANMHSVYRHQARIGDCPRKPGVASKDQQAQNPIHGAYPEARPLRPCYPGKRQVLPGNRCPPHTAESSF